MHTSVVDEAALRRVLDRSEIEDVLARYARAVDRGDWEQLWSVYHPDAHDNHGEYDGDVAGLVHWLERRFAGVHSSSHFLANSLIEFAAADLAVVETYFLTRRLRAPVAGERTQLGADEAILRESWGRYVDRFERRDAGWRIASRHVVLDGKFTTVVRFGARERGTSWGTRDVSDPAVAARRSLGLE